MEYCETCKMDTIHGGYDFCPTETKANLDAANLHFEEARKIIEQVSWSPAFKKFYHLGQEQDPLGVHAFTAKYAAGDASQAGLPLESEAPVAEKTKPDTCENYRRARGAEVSSRYCSAFEANSKVHAPTCQFAQKPSDDSPKKDNRCSTCGGSGLRPGWDVTEKQICPRCGTDLPSNESHSLFCR